MKKVLKIGVLLMISSNLMFGGMFDKFEQKQIKEENTRIENGESPTEKKNIVNILKSKKNTEKIVSRLKSNSLTQTEYDKQQQNDFLKQEIKQKKLILKTIKEKMSFVKSEKKIKLKRKQKYIDIFIPFNKLSTIKFDQKIEDLKYLKTENVVIKNNMEDQNIEIINKDPNLELSLNIAFLDGTEIVLTLKVGDSSAKRYIDHSIYTNGTSLAAKALFLKQTNVKRIHNDFNNKAMLMIFARVTKNALYRSLRENIVPVDKILYNGESEIETLYGLKNIDYKLKLHNVYESPFIKADKKDPRFLRKLVLMELTMTNNSKTEVLKVNETMIKNTFGNYVAIYLGDLEKGDNVLSPGAHLRFLVVIEDKVRK
jgi:hypothetical protein